MGLILLKRLWMLALVTVLLSSFSFTEGMSSQPRPLKHLESPSTLSIEILPRRPSGPNGLQPRDQALNSPVLRYSDTIRIALSAFGNEFHLHLSPNDDLIHPAARINIYRTLPGGESVLDRTEPLPRHTVKAYTGHVIHPEDSLIRMTDEAVGVRTPSGRNIGWARILVHHQGDPAIGLAPVFEGAFSVDGVVHHVMQREKYLKTKHAFDPMPHGKIVALDKELVIFRDSDVMTPSEMAAKKMGSASQTGHMCSHDNLEYNKDPSRNPVLRTKNTAMRDPWLNAMDMLNPGVWLDNNSTKKRDIITGSTPTDGNDETADFRATIGNTANCPKTQKVLFMGVAADCQYTQRYGSVANATQAILNDWNNASSLFKRTFNVSLGIVQLDVHDSTCPNPVDQDKPWNVECGRVTLNERLSLFSGWRGRQPADAGLWHLMSGCPTGSEVGVAWLGTMCMTDSSGSPPSVVSGTAVSTVGRTEWQVVAHEIGHNFGAVHDCTDTCNSSPSTPCCPLSTGTCDARGGFLMNPVSGANEDGFSPCTIGNVCSAMSTEVDSTCLQDANNLDRQTISLQMCGNGIVERGEDCDPGLGRDSACCDPQTCRFRTNAQCDPASSDCCTDQCRFAPRTQLCRAARDENCDTAEFCSGASASCPADVTKQNGVECGRDGADTLTCASGLCTSITQQCKSIGSAMNLQRACPQSDSSCSVSCQDPRNSNQCIVLTAQLPDGLPCGFGGTCLQGQCQPGTLFETATAWYVQNLQISIPITVVSAIFAIFLIWGLIVLMKRCCCGGRNKTVKFPATGSRSRAAPPQMVIAAGTPIVGPDPATLARKKASGKQGGLVPISGGPRIGMSGSGSSGPPTLPPLRSVSPAFNRGLAPAFPAPRARTGGGASVDSIPDSLRPGGAAVDFRGSAPAPQGQAPYPPPPSFGNRPNKQGWSRLED